MDRRKFISNLGTPVLTACAVCLGACSKSDSSPSSGGTPPPSGSVNFTIDLNSQLTAVGSSLVQTGVIVVRLAAGNTPSSFTAVQVACTHQGTSIFYDTSANRFHCPNHGSNFSNSGTVINGPVNSAGSATNLKVYNIAISGSTMTITG